MLVYPKDRSAHTLSPTATLRLQLQIKPAVSPSYCVLTPGQPVQVLTLQRQAPDRVAARVQIFQSLVFFFFCVPSYITGVHHSSSPTSVFPAISLGFTILPLLLCSQLYQWGSPFFLFFFCVPSYITGVHHISSSSSVFPAIPLGVHHFG